MEEKLTSMEKQVDENVAKVKALETEVKLLKSENLEIKLKIPTILDQMKSYKNSYMWGQRKVNIHTKCQRITN